MTVRLYALLALAAALVTALLSPAPASAGVSDWSRTDGARARLVVGAPADDGTVPAALEVRLRYGWKTYWRAPGALGYPPRLDWSGARGLAGAVLSYPTPERFSALGESQIGYARRVAFPITLQPEAAGADLDVRLQAELLLCKDLCVPARFDLGPVAPGGSVEAERIIAGARASRPDTPAAADVAVGPLELHDGLISFRFDDGGRWSRPDVFPDAPGPWDFGLPTAARVGDGWRIDIPVREGTAPADLAEQAVHLTLSDGTRAVTASAAFDPPAGAPVGLAMPLALAVVGGLILNLMPCVLPVLSLKLMGALELRGAARRAIRRGFLASAAGIFLAFSGLAAGAIALRLAGEQVGWGMQFQQPLFLAALASVTALFAANLAGWFDVRLPANVSDRLARLGGRRTPDAPTPVGHHLATGFAATLLATPCSAPFLGTAIGFALSRGPVEIALVFAALALGFAAPYLAVAAWPALIRLLPRPGRWMLWMKRVMAVAMAGTTVWLGSLLLATAGPAPWVIAGLALLALSGAAILILQGRPRAALRQGVPAGVVAALLLALIAWPGSTPTDGVWQTFSAKRLQAGLAAGETVVVDVTADWCVTCQANKAAAWRRERVRAALARPDVTALRADWTRPDPAIGAFLRGHGRHAIPFSVVYTSTQPDGTILPELLTPAIVVDALEPTRE